LKVPVITVLWYRAQRNLILNIGKKTKPDDARNSLLNLPVRCLFCDEFNTGIDFLRISVCLHRVEGNKISPFPKKGGPEKLPIII